MLGRKGRGMAIRVFEEESCEKAKIQNISEVALAETEMLKRFIFGREEA